MNRLTHSIDGFIRSMQMSQTKLFAFTEGKINDPYFYDKVCLSVCEPANVSYTICRAQEIPGDTGGKGKLIKFFDYLKRKSKLLNDFQGKKTAIVFFLDKDIDDFLRKQKRSNHVIYTKYYNLENHLFIDGDIIEAVAASTSLEKRLFVKDLGNSDNWRQLVAEKWKEWIILCLLARKRNINCECTFNVPSRINVPPFEATIDEEKYSFYLESFKRWSRLDTKQFKRALKNTSSVVNNQYAQGKHDLLFNGKWYSPFIEMEVKRIVGRQPYNDKGLQNRVESSLLITLNFNDMWADHFKDPVRRVVGFLS